METFFKELSSFSLKAKPTEKPLESLNQKEKESHQTNLEEILLAQQKAKLAS